MRTTTALLLAMGLAISASARAQTPPKDTDPKSRTSLEFTGCVSDQPSQSGTFTFPDAQTGGQFRLTGKKMQKYAGKTVSIVSGSNKGVAISGGLWPSPNVAAQAGAIDPAQASIARQPGGAASGAAPTNLPELKVVRVRNVGAACR
jgi:hypothetical protein